MWQLNRNICFNWFVDIDEVVLFVPEASETLLINKTAYYILQGMLKHSERMLTKQILNEIQHKNEMSLDKDELDQQTEALMDVLMKKHLAKKIECDSC